MTANQALRPPHAIRVAAAQYPISQPADFAAWQAMLGRWVAEGASTGADLLVFPEYGAIELAATRGAAIAGDLATTLTAVAALMPQIDAAHVQLAARHNVHILAASGPRFVNGRDASGGICNSARLVTPSGRVGVQDKLIMTPFEVGWGVRAGKVLRVFDTALGRIGIAICYDSEFPLLVRAMTETGAELILIPSCTERLSGASRVRTAALARALESQVATVTSPTVGEAQWSPAVDHNTGAAGVFVPADAALLDAGPLAETGVLAEGVLNQPGWVAATIPLARLRALRTSGEMRNHADWSRQPGVAGWRANVEVIALDLTLDVPM
jgi:predicted amidohydrolase